jgi:hypothetical protein
MDAVSAKFGGGMAEMLLAREQPHSKWQLLRDWCPAYSMVIINEVRVQSCSATFWKATETGCVTESGQTSEYHLHIFARQCTALYCIAYGGVRDTNHER